MRAVDDITLSVRKNEIYGIAGESSSGKTTLIKTFAAAIRPPLRIVGGSMTYHFKNGDIDPYAAPKAEVDALRWKHLSYIMQGSMSLLNPVRRVRRTFEDFAFRPMGLPSSEFWGRVEAHLQRLGLSPDVLSAYPHQLSGGMRQRVTIALATVCQPEFVIADEPTTALDVVVQKDVLAMIRDVQRQMGSSVVFVTHDMSVHANTADRIGIIYAGRLVEEAPTRTLFAAPRHPYTAHLVAALPRIGDTTPKAGARGTTAQPCRTAHGLPLSPSMPAGHREVQDRGAATRAGRAGSSLGVLAQRRRASARPRSRSEDVGGRAMTALLEVSHVSKRFVMGGQLSRGYVDAVVDANLSLSSDSSEIFTIIGESGSGKTTLARMILGLEQPTSGDILFEGKSNAERRTRAARREFLRRVQPVFQNPFETFNPLKRVDRYLYASARRLFGAKTKAAAEAVMDEALHKVGLSLREVAGRYAHELSGGQLQRVAIARALIPNPSLLIADEPVSMVDASLRMSIVNLLRDLRDEFGVSVIYITHDLATAYYISDRLVIMQKGYVVEMGPARPILDAPEHPYSRLLKESVLSITDAGTDGLVPADRSEATAALERAAEGTLQEREDGRFVRV